MVKKTLKLWYLTMLNFVKDINSQLQVVGSHRSRCNCHRLRLHHGQVKKLKLVSLSFRQIIPLGLIALQNHRESIDAHDNESCYVNATLPDFEPNFPPPEDFNGFGEGDTNMSHLLLCDYLISFFSVLSHNVCICWICKLPNLPGVFHQPFSTHFHPFSRHFPAIPNPPGVFHQPLSRELLTDLTLMFLCSQI